MRSIVHLFWQICLLRQSPAQVPSEGWFVAVVVIANLLCSLLVSLGYGGDADVITIANSIVVAQAVTALLVFLALSLRGLGARFVTTVTAWFGCDLIITACFGLVLPVTSVLGPFVLSMVFLVFLIWSVAVSGFILHRALEVQLAIGIGVAMGISLLSAMVAQVTAAS
jgi:hypothetical protein